MHLEASGGNGPSRFRVTTDNAPDSDVYDPLVRLLRAGEDPARLERHRLRGDLPRRRPGLPSDRLRRVGRLDGAAGPDRRRADRRLHGALAPGPRRPARRAARCLSRERLARRTEPRAAATDARLRDRSAAAVARLAAAAVDLELVLHRAA